MWENLSLTVATAQELLSLALSAALHSYTQNIFSDYSELVQKATHAKQTEWWDSIKPEWNL